MRSAILPSPVTAMAASGGTPLLLIKERPHDGPAIERLVALGFGEDRKKLTVYTLRNACAPVADLSYIAIDAQGRMQGTIRFWPVLIEDLDLRVVLLGPLAVETDQQGRGVGKSLIKRGLEEAEHQGYDLCLVVGDQRLYTSFAFTNASQLGLRLPGWVDPARFQLKELRRGVLGNLLGFPFKERMVLPFTG